MTRIRVLMSSMPPILSDILHDLVATEPQVELLEPASGSLEELHSAVDRLQPNVVMLVSDSTAAEAEDFLYAHPRVRLVTVSGDARVASLHALHPRCVVLHDVSPQALRDAILGVAR